MTITTALGNINISVDNKNLKLLMFLDSLKDKIEIYGLDEISDLIDNASSVKEKDDKISELETLIEEKDKEISELEDNEDNDDFYSEIDCGVGTVKFEEPDNILLQDLMENFETAIKKTNPKKVSELLASI